MSNPLAFPHISRLVDLPPDLARESFDMTTRDLARGPAGTPWTIAVPSGRLDLRRNGILSDSPRGSWPYRQVTGRLRAPWMRNGLLVQLELLPWSDTHTELGLGLLVAPRLLGGRHGRAYLRVGGDVVEALRSAMNDRLANLVTTRWARGTEEEFAVPLR
jgi:hypothetical protein